jgi:nucleoside-diphosphate-sugar epimerase
MQNHLFCFGLGYCASHFADFLLPLGWKISGTCRSEDKLLNLSKKSIQGYLFNHKLNLDTVTHILLSIPPSIDDGDIVLNQYFTLLKNMPNLKWVGYLSTTGVYGNHNGDWVDENTMVKPTNKRSEYRVSAEKDWLNSGLPAHIFRISGIYGQGRSAIDAIKNKTARRIDKPGQVFCRIHVEDICQILYASINNPNPGQIYNCADDYPSSQADVVLYAANLLQVEPPELVAIENSDLSQMALSFYEGCRRVSNRKIKEELGVKLKYPNYMSGLESVLNY